MKKNSYLNDISLRPLLIISIIVSGLIPIMIVSLVSFKTSKDQLKEQVFRQLESVRNIKKFQIENFFNNKIKEISVLSSNPYVLNSFENLKNVYKKSNRKEFKGKINFKFSAPDDYIKIHDKYFQHYKYIIEKFDYYDLFLIDKNTSDTIFSVKKESDFAIQINKVSSSLKDVWKKVVKTGEIALSDTKPYPPSNFAPAQFLAAPIFKNKKLVGVLAVQISLDSIDEIMKERSGMWESGETYLVGQDKKMRSDSHMDKINHSVEKSFKGNVFNNGVDTIASNNALKGMEEKQIIKNYNGKKVLSAYTFIEVKSIKWAMIAEVEAKEINVIIADKLNKKIVIIFFSCAFILLILSMIITVFISNGIKNTIAQLERMIKDVLNGNLQTRGIKNSVGADFREVVESANQLLDAFSTHCEERQKLEENLYLNEKLQAIGTLAGGIAHDFNNILTSLFAFSHLLKEELKQCNKNSEHIYEMQKALKRASELVNQILTFGRQNDEKKQIIDISTIILDTVKLVNATLPKNITILTNFSKKLTFIEASPSQINQIVMNLCTNAIYAIGDDDGNLKISTEVVKLTKSKNNKDKLYCKLSVEDTGCGIPKEVEKRIFEPFFTTKPLGKGSGMGLSMIHGIILNYGGFVEVESEIGKGSKFICYLPVSKQNNNTEALEINESIKKGNGEKIIFVDDEIQICKSQSQILSDAGFNVYGFTDPMEAYEMFKNSYKSIDLVITDLNMPKLSGIQLTNKIKKINPQIPIVLTTGFLNFGKSFDEMELEQLGINKLLKKPFDNLNLLKTIENVLNY